MWYYAVYWLSALMRVAGCVQSALKFMHPFANDSNLTGTRQHTCTHDLFFFLCH